MTGYLLDTNTASYIIQRKAAGRSFESREGRRS